jgi:hypothetical protein
MLLLSRSALIVGMTVFLAIGKFGLITIESQPRLIIESFTVSAAPARVFPPP